MRGLLLGLFFLLFGSQSSFSLVKVCFSPNEECNKIVVQMIDSTVSTLDIAMYSFTRDEFRNAIVRAVNRGVIVRLIADPVQSANTASDVDFLSQNGVWVKKGKEKSGIMHHKFAIFDGTIVLTGSFNWTDSAVNSNNENLFITNKQVGRFAKEFTRLWLLLK